jgi:uncharacterized membrane protein YcaP (DUF421 family)
MNGFWDSVVGLLGLNLKPETLSFAQLTCRALIIFTVALILMRLGHKRSLARKSAFDTTFVIIVGAVLARAINGSGPFFPTIGISCILVALHWALAHVAFRSPGFESLIKGRADDLVHDGRKLPEAMRRHAVSSSDLDEDLHLRGHRSIDGIARARIERSGDISFASE